MASVRLAVQRQRLLLIGGLLILLSPGSAAAIGQPFNDTMNGIACDWYDSATQSKWQRRQGDWEDARGQAWGDQPFGSSVLLTGKNPIPVADLDVTSLVQLWLSGGAPNQGMLLKPVASEKADAVIFFSRESSEEAKRPVLELLYIDGSKRLLQPLADATLGCSTYTAQGVQDRLTVSGGHYAALFFDMPASPANVALRQATLRLTVARRFGNLLDVGIFRLVLPVLDLPLPDAPAETGLASLYARDEDLKKDPNVLFFEGFESWFWKSSWSGLSNKSDYETVSDQDPYGYWPLQGRALRVRLAKGKQLGLDMSYRFLEKQQQEPEEIYFRYYLSFGADWHPVADGGKLPGLSGDYGQAGWGGRRANGSNGWSLRSSFLQLSGGQNKPLLPTQLATYAYHADMSTPYGDSWLWSHNNLGLLENYRWYCIEQYVKLNTPGQSDGILRVWVDGKRTLDKRDIRFRDTVQLKIERVWMNVFHGGTTKSHQDQHLYIDNVVIARQYIGPIP
jgi:hypothetical protein